MEQEYIDNLLTKVLAGEATADEQEIVAKWRKESLSNQAYYEETKILFDRIDSLKDDVKVNTEAAWKKLDQRISSSEARIIPLYKQNRFIQAAASIFLLVSLGFLLNWFFSSKDTNQFELSSTSTSKKQVLPDGSSIILEKNSQLSYVETKTNERRVKLKGKAHFNVVHDEEKNFVIEVNEVLIKDIGTAFYVNAIPESNLVEVLVEEGEVQFYTETNKGLSLMKNESATYNKLTKEFIRLSPSASDNTFKHLSRKLNFENSTLEDVVAEVNFIYGVKISLSDPKMKACRLSVNFNNEDLNVLLSVIAETLDLKIHKQDSSIILEGKPCAE